ncbi:hypothetical protein KVT40_004304 [Elsinoe batatas]|uniref:Sister chromatid cohesion protein Dcc1 n=1 Tax=Elsinoe batatas TaxID=2601811 RepID=A0A8K0L667_9PEZI|nr:hypothetical protein KVT40_004304 [Elsinoe batatas]
MHVELNQLIISQFSKMPSKPQMQIPMLLSAQQDQFRLIELPAELVELLATQDPPTLYFKSAKTGHAALCSSNQTFELRQVQTSNSVHITTPIEVVEQDRTPTAGLISIAQCGSSLELTGKAQSDATALLKALLPIFHEERAENSTLETSARSKLDIFSEIPLSEGECDRDWRGLYAFETGNPKQSFRPSPRLLVKAWSSIMSSAVLDCADLAGPVSEVALQAWMDASDEVPDALMHTIVNHLRNVNSDGATDGLVTFDKTRTIQFTGTQLLYDLLEVAEDDYVRQWYNLLPEKWRDGAVVSDLPVKVHKSYDGKIRLPGADGKDEAITEKTTPAPAIGKRKWHDKFKQARNAR